MAPTSSCSDATVLSPVHSPFLAANWAAHRARWQIELPLETTGAVAVSRAGVLQASRDGVSSWPVATLLTARLQDASGASLKMHSDRDPHGEAAAWLHRALPDHADNPVLTVVGAGLGYVVDAIERSSRASVLVLEPEPDVIPWMLARRDWTALIDAGRLLILAGPDYARATQAWRIFRSAHRSTPPALVHQVITRARPDATAAAGPAVARALHGAQANAVARRRFEAPYLLNTLANVAAHQTSPGIASLAAVATDRPVVIAGAGPSLNRNIEELRPHRAEVVLVATDTALAPLLAAGLPPDYVVAVDPGPLNARHLAQAQVPPDTVLVAECSIDPASFGPFGSRVVLFRVADHAPWPWLTGVGVDPGTLRAWGSVITSAFDLALRLGGHPVVFIGTDLAYTGDQPYCRGTRYEEDWSAEAEARDLPLQHVWAAHIERHAVATRDVNGRPIQSAAHLIAYRDWLVQASEDLTATPGRPMRPRVVNATGAGILAGRAIAQAPLADVLRGRSRPAAPFSVPHPRHVQSPVVTHNPLDLHLLSFPMHRDQSTSSFTPTAGGRTPYMDRPRKDRARETRQLRATHGTDRARWQTSDNLDVAWERRAAVAAALVPPDTRVLDLGAGREALSRHLPAGTTYVPADVVRRSPRTVVVDVNAGQFPSGSYDVITALGVLEYVHDLRALLTTAATAAPMLVASYCVVTGGARDVRLQRGWMHDLILADVLDLFTDTGWQVASATRLDVVDDFDQWLFACRRADARQFAPSETTSSRS